MISKTLVMAVAAVFLSVGFFSTMTPETEASHVKRIVWPYGVDERHIPVVAGFKVVPDPLQCNDGVAAEAGNTLLETSFEEPVAFGSDRPLTAHLGIDHWHQTDFAGKGTDVGHEGDGKLYFGRDSTGNVKYGFWRLAGTATFDIEIPEGPTPYYIAFNTKWEGEWFEGYDHMWVEVMPEDGRHYILCTLNPEGRGDQSSSDFSTAGSCSPYHAGPCPSSARGLNYLGLFGTIDEDAPHWEARYVQIPSIFNGQNVQVRFSYDSADGVANTFMGWMIDDLSITDTVIPTPNTPPLLPL